MNFIRPLALFCFAATLQGQAIDAHATGGGELKIGADVYRFELKALFTAPPKGGLPGAFRIQGRLVPAGSAPPFDLDLTLLKTGALYMLRIDRKGSDPYPDSWAATQKSRVRPVSLQDGPGGRVEVECLGTLAGVISRKPRTAAWRGHLWATFPGEAVTP